MSNTSPLCQICQLPLTEAQARRFRARSEGPAFDRAKAAYESWYANHPFYTSDPTKPAPPYEFSPMHPRCEQGQS